MNPMICLTGNNSEDLKQQAEDIEYYRRKAEAMRSECRAIRAHIDRVEQKTMRQIEEWKADSTGPLGRSPQRTEHSVGPRSGSDAMTRFVSAANCKETCITLRVFGTEYGGMHYRPWRSFYEKLIPLLEEEKLYCQFVNTPRRVYKEEWFQISKIPFMTADKHGLVDNYPGW